MTLAMTSHPATLRSPTVGFGGSVLMALAWSASLMPTPLMEPGSIIAVTAAGAWLVLILGVHAVADTPSELNALLRCASRACGLGSIVLLLMAFANVPMGLAQPFSLVTLAFINLAGLLFANALMAVVFLGERAAGSFSKRVRLWALLNLTFVLILAVVVAGGGW